MRIKSVQVTNFKCVEDSGSFSLDENITCLVGKNESGKSAILKALYRLNPDVEGEENFDPKEYPRKKYDEFERLIQNAESERVLSVTFALTESELAQIDADYIPNTLLTNEVTVNRGFTNRNTWSLNINQSGLVEHYVNSAAFPGPEKNKYKGAATISALTKSLMDRSDRSEKETALLATLSKHFPSGSAEAAVIEILEKMMPRFLYFADYYRLEGRVALEELKRKKTQGVHFTPNDRVFLALMKQAGTDFTAIESIRDTEDLIARLEAIENRLSTDILQYWSQNKHISVKFEFLEGMSKDPAPFNSGKVFHTRIKNQRHQVSVPFDDRSTGFIWFFSFLVWFSQIRKQYGEELVIMLDEPGLSLHASAQADLLRYMREKLGDYQVIFTTHSPFIIDPDRLDAVRVVEDKTGPNSEVLGTKVSADVLQTDRESVFPLQAAMGYDISQTLFVGKHTLILEGPSDILYLQVFTSLLRKEGRVGLDKRWVLCPSGGIDKVASFVSLFYGNRLHIAVLTDLHEGDLTKLRTLKESQVLNAGHVFSVNEFCDQRFADIEDVIGLDNYLSLVNSCYELDSTTSIALPEEVPGDLLAAKYVESRFAIMPPEAPEFDHFTPAYFLLQHIHTVPSSMPTLTSALDRFEIMFKTVNKLLED